MTLNAKASPKKTRCDQVLDILRDGYWHAISEFHNPQTGSSGDRRLRELRQKGYNIAKRKREGSAQWEYRLEEA